MRSWAATLAAITACAPSAAVIDPARLEHPGPIRFELTTSSAGDLARSDGAGSIVPGGGEPSRGEADWYAPGITLADFDSDGWLDIYLPRYDNTRPELRKNLLYRNLGDGTFADVTDRAGVGGAENSSCACAADIDGDGDLDLFVGNDLAPSRLYLNHGGLRFTDVAAERGLGRILRAFTCNFIDFDRDGRLDLFVGQWDAAGPNGHHGGRGSHVAPGVLYRQKEDGSFEDVTERAGLGCHGRSTLASGFADLNGDFLEDLVLANDFFDDCLYLNNGDGTFTDVSDAWDVGPDTLTAMGVAFGDADGDGDLDVYVTDDRLADRSIGNAFYRNERTRTTQMAPQLGLDGRFSWGAAFADFDNDGRIDLFAATRLGDGPVLLWHNQGDLAFEEIGGEAIGEFRDARGAAVGDIDRDGRLDLVIALRREPIALYLNRTEPAGNWLRIDGLPIGAWVEVTAAEIHQVRSVVAGDSYRSQSQSAVQFGLGRAETADVEVRFPSGERVHLAEVPANHAITLETR